MRVGGQRHDPVALPEGKTRYPLGPRAGLDGKSRPHRDSIPRTSSPYRVAIPTVLPRPRNVSKNPRIEDAEMRI